MSRGPGLLQRAILNCIETSPTPLTFETLRWMLWDSRLGSSDGQSDVATPRPSVRPQLPAKWNTSLRRAVLELANRLGARIVVQDRRLATLAEMVTHFPNKTLSGAIRSLRLSLLPPLIEWIQRDGPAPRYTPADNELFHLTKLPAVEVRRLQAQWARLEPSLTNLLPSLDASARKPLLLLVAKGYSLFDTADMKLRRSFAELAKACLDANILPPDLRAQVVAIDKAILPSDEAGFLRLKSFVHSVADVPHYRRCCLKKEVIEHLDAVRPDIVRSLPGYVAAPEPSQGRRYIAMRDPKHSEKLHLLINQTVFQNFRFIYPNNA